MSKIAKETTKHARPTLTTVGLERMNLTDDFRFRVKDDENTIAEYASIYGQYLEDLSVAESLVEAQVVDSIDVSKAVCPLGAITVLQEGDRYFVVEGRLRFLAAERAGMKELPCEIYTDRDEALRTALGNNKHGLPLSKADRVNCIKIAITKLAISSNREIARMLGCSPRAVDLIVVQHQLREPGQKVMGRDGKLYGAKKPKATEKKPKADNTLVKLLNALKLSKTDDDEKRVGSFVEAVKKMLTEGIAEDKHRQEFLQRVREIVEGGGV